MQTPPNRCDGCTSCCTILGVVELKKPPNAECCYRLTGRCSIHNDQLLYPKTCRDFACGYIRYPFTPEFRPDRCHIVLTGADTDLEASFIHVDPAHPDAHRSALGHKLIQTILRLAPFPNILVTIGDRQEIISRTRREKHILEAKLQKLREQSA